MEEQRRLYLSRDKLIAGVAGGLAEYLGIDPTIVRLLFVLGLWVNGITLVLYLAGMIIIPERPAEEIVYGDELGGIENIRQAARRLTQAADNKTLGYLLIGLGVILLLRLFVSVDWSIILPALLIVGGAVILIRGKRGN